MNVKLIKILARSQQLDSVSEFENELEHSRAQSLTSFAHDIFSSYVSSNNVNEIFTRASISMSNQTYSFHNGHSKACILQRISKTGFHDEKYLQINLINTCLVANNKLTKFD